MLGKKGGFLVLALLLAPVAAGAVECGEDGKGCEAPAPVPPQTQRNSQCGDPGFIGPCRPEDIERGQAAKAAAEAAAKAAAEAARAEAARAAEAAARLGGDRRGPGEGPRVAAPIIPRPDPIIGNSGSQVGDYMRDAGLQAAGRLLNDPGIEAGPDEAGLDPGSGRGFAVMPNGERITVVGRQAPDIAAGRFLAAGAFQTLIEQENHLDLIERRLATPRYTGEHQFGPTFIHGCGSGTDFDGNGRVTCRTVRPANNFLMAELPGIPKS